MKKERFTIGINAPAEKVWNVLWNDETYRAWTHVFSEGSYALSDWKEGSKIQFLGSDGSGMFSVIDKLIPNEFMSFKHMGIVKDGEEQAIDQETESWTGAKENYTLKGSNGSTELIVEMDVTDDHASYFHDIFPKALQKVKELSES